MSIKFAIKNDMDVELIRESMNDEYVVQAMRVSTKGAFVEETVDEKALASRINFLR